jgi:pectate lyase
MSMIWRGGVAEPGRLRNVRNGGYHRSINKTNLSLKRLALAICLPCVSWAIAQSLITNGDFGTGNLSGWTIVNTAPTTITYDDGTGNPAGSAFLARNNSTVAANGNYVYQIIPVVNGRQYQLSARWKGDLLNGGTGRNWAEVFVNFTATNTAFVPGSIRYKKATDGGSNATPMPWDWESIAASPDNANPGPADGIFIATGNYLTIAFNLGGRAQTSNNTQPGYYWVDNVTVTPYPPETPVSAPMLTNATLAGNSFILQGRNGPTNGAYQVLYSTNPTLPLDSWLGLGVQAFDGNGNFSVTTGFPEDASGFYRLRVVSSTPVSAPAITSPPQDLAIAAGQNATFSVTATGTASLTYRWYFNTNTLLDTGSSASVTITNAQLTNSGKYSVAVSNLVGIKDSGFATLTVTNNTQPPGILAQPTNLTVFVGQTANFSVTAASTSPLRHQWYYNTNTVLLNQTNATLTLANVQLTNAGKYSVTVTNDFGTTNSLFATLTVSSNASPELIGWATVAGYGQTTTTGGGTATPETVTDLATLRSRAGDSTPRVVLLSGTFTTGGTPITIANNKTLRGVGSNVVIQGGIDINAKSNIIVQNLAIKANGAGGTPADAAAVRSSHHLWFDHVSFSDAGDGLLDLTIASDVITVSWCKFYYTDSGNGHRLASLVGNSSNSTGDTDHNDVTYHHNWFSTLVDQRMPRLLFGKGHMFNNYYNSPGNGYCIGTGSWGSALVENNYFRQVNSPHQSQDGNPSYIVATGNIYDNTTGNRHTGLLNPDASGNPGPWSPPYPYALDAAADVPGIVTLGAGPQ